jgi:hypothetical protein
MVMGTAYLVNVIADGNGDDRRDPETSMLSPRRCDAVVL